MLWFRISIWFVWRSLQSHFPGNLNSYRKCRWCHCPVSHQATISRTTVYYECCWKRFTKKVERLDYELSRKSWCSSDLGFDFLVVQPKKLKVMWQIISSQVPPSLDLGLQVRLPIGQRWAAESGQPIAFFQPQSKVIPRFAYMGWVCSTRITRTGECIEIISWGAFEQINEFGRDDMIAQRLAEALRISLRANT